MSQAKVDRRKYEKKNRKKLERQRKIRTTLKCVTAALVVGAIIGVPTGIKIYKAQPKFVGDSTVEAFIGNYITENHADDIPSFSSTTDEEQDAVEDAAMKAIEEASGGQLEQVDSDDLEDAIGTDAEDTSETTEETESTGESEDAEE